MLKRKEPSDVCLELAKKFNLNRNKVYNNFLSFIPWCNRLGEHYEKKWKIRQEQKIIPKRYYLYTSKYLESRPSEADQLLLDLRGALSHFDKIGYQRSAHQREFHESFIAACIRHIYADEFSDNFVKILEENGWEEARQEVMVRFTSKVPCSRSVFFQSGIVTAIFSNFGHGTANKYSIIARCPPCAAKAKRSCFHSNISSFTMGPKQKSFSSNDNFSNPFISPLVTHC